MIRFLRMIGEDDRVKGAGSDIDAIVAAKKTAPQEFFEMTMARPIRPPFNEDSINDVRAQHLDRLKQEAAIDLRMFSDEAPLEVDTVVDLGIQALFRRPDFFLSETGIVIAGYGTGDFFPSYREFSCLGFLGKRLCYEEKSDQNITPRDSGFLKRSPRPRRLIPLRWDSVRTYIQRSERTLGQLSKKWPQKSKRRPGWPVRARNNSSMRQLSIIPSYGET
jgi:hypothetical protein